MGVMGVMGGREGKCGLCVRESGRGWLFAW